MTIIADPPYAFVQTVDSVFREVGLQPDREPGIERFELLRATRSMLALDAR